MNGWRAECVVKVFKCCFTFTLSRRAGESGSESCVIKTLLLRISDANANFRIFSPTRWVVQSDDLN